jgi:hypothetical protein
VRIALISSRGSLSAATAICWATKVPATGLVAPSYAKCSNPILPPHGRSETQSYSISASLAWKISCLPSMPSRSRVSQIANSAWHLWLALRRPMHSLLVRRPQVHVFCC